LRAGKYCALKYALLAAVFIARTGSTDEIKSAPTDTTAGGGTTVSEKKQEEKKPDMIEPLFVRPLTKIETGRNDSNPTWSPFGTLIAFERSRGDKKEIIVMFPDGTPVQTVYFKLSEVSKEMQFFFPGVYEEVSYNAGISWSPAGDRFVFMSNGGEGNYDLYLQEVGGRTAVRLTDHKEKDGQAHCSPVANTLVFVSGRTGYGDIYLMDISTHALTRLTQGKKEYLYPQWSPDGKKIVMMQGSNENHDIVLITDVTRPLDSQKALTTWSFDDLRPVWSPDGKKIAFYSNYNPAGDPKMWSIIVIAADGSDQTQGDGLAAKVVATDVIPDVEAGPAWMPDSNRIVYVKNDRQEYNPIYIADIARKTSMLLKTDTKMNHDLSCSRDGTIAFRAQVDQWDQIYLARLKN
jgi:Tol biopolymer transport system component